MRSSDLYKTLLEYSYFFNSRFGKMKTTAEQVAKAMNDIKSVKVVNEDPVTLEFVTTEKLSQERQNQIADYIMQQQDNYYSFNIEQTDSGFRMVCEVGYIPMDDSLPERHDPTVLQKSLTRKVMAKMHSLQNREPSKYRGAGKARCISNYQEFDITFPYLDKEAIRDYSNIISDIIEYNDGEVQSINVEGESLKIKYKDNSEDITSESGLYEAVSDREKEYQEYINNHVLNVKKSFNELLALDDCPEYIKENIELLQEIINNHDSSKYTGDEFVGYRKHFYPDNDQEKLDTEGFETAWIHHYSNNPHHWEYWCLLDPESGNYVLKNDIDEDEYKLYTVERVCDWCAMSRQFNNRIADWYKENKNTIVQPDFIVPFIEDLIKLCNDNEIDKEK